MSKIFLNVGVAYREREICTQSFWLNSDAFTLSEWRFCKCDFMKGSGSTPAPFLHTTHTESKRCVKATL